MFRRVAATALASLAGICLATGAYAATAGFENRPAPDMIGGTLVDGGLHFQDDEFYISTPVTSLPYPHLSQFMETGSSEVEPLTITLDAGGAFDLQSLQIALGGAGGQVLGGFDTVTITGQRSAACEGGPTVCFDPSVVIQVTQQWSGFDLGGFTGLTSLTISQPVLIDPKTGQPAIDHGWLAFDNFNYTVDADGGVSDGSAPASVTGGLLPVPEPAAWSLMIIGLGAIGGLSRRRRRAEALAAAI